MEHGFHSIETTVAFALLAGVVAQVLARHLRVPGIILLLGAGVLLGPDVIGIVQPALLGSALLTLVGFAVAVILFEGGLNLQLGRLRREEIAIRRLVTLGALVTTGGAALAARLVLDWPWRTAWLFGTLVIVNGPTVITPLLRRFKVEHQAATVLEAEGVLIDAVGAVVATVALEIALAPSTDNIALGVVHVPMSLGAGAGIGTAGGFGLAALLRQERLIPEGLGNIVVLTTVLALYQASNALIPESGIAAATAAGIVLGNRAAGLRELQEFKEQLTFLFIGMLFVLLAADVRLSEVRALGLPGVLTVVVLIAVVRPLNVALSTLRTELNGRQRLFIAAIGPRGIVAAAVAAYFSAELSQSGVGGGEELRAMVFLVIVVTVLVSGLAGGPLASMLGLRRATGNGYLILGAGELARLYAHLISQLGKQEAVCIDTNPASCDEAQRQGLRVIYGNGLRDSVLARAAADTRAGALGLSTNTEVNLLFTQRARQSGIRRVFAAIGRKRDATSLRLLHASEGKVLFGHPADIDVWQVRLRRGDARVVHASVTRDLPAPGKTSSLADLADNLAVALLRVRNGQLTPFAEGSQLQAGDLVVLLTDRRQQAATDAYLKEHGLVAQPDPPEAPQVSRGRGSRSSIPKASGAG